VRDEMPLVEGAQDIHVTMGSSSNEGPTLENVDVLRVEVILEAATFGAADFHGPGTSPEVWERAKRDVEGAGRAADTAMERLISWIRARHGQVWLGLYGEDVRRVGSEEVVDIEAARRLPWPARLDMAFSVVEPNTPLNRERLEALQPLVEAGSAPGLAELLLADARFIAASAEPPDPSRALLVAAVACEVKIKAFLRECANAEQAPLVELLLSNPRDWSVAAAALFDQPLRIVARDITQGRAGEGFVETRQRTFSAAQCASSPRGRALRA
jgi:hypothetical protein